MDLNKSWHLEPAQRWPTALAEVLLVRASEPSINDNHFRFMMMVMVVVVMTSLVTYCLRLLSTFSHFWWKFIAIVQIKGESFSSKFFAFQPQFPFECQLLHLVMDELQMDWKTKTFVFFPKLHSNFQIETLNSNPSVQTLWPSLFCPSLQVNFLSFSGI